MPRLDVFGNLAPVLGEAKTECPDCRTLYRPGERHACAPCGGQTAAERRKATPICRGVLDYFPLALAEIARVSKAATDQHHPGEPMHWDRSKSPDHADCILRHMIDRGKIDSDGQRHTAKVAWRALALLQEELENG